MLRDSSVPLSESFPSTGSTPRPKGEKVRRYAGKTGEANRRTLAKASKKDASMISGEGSPKGIKESGGTKEIVRATTKFLLEPWLAGSPGHEKKPRTCGGKDGGCQACKLLFDLKVTQSRCARGINAAMRELWRVDSQTLDAYLLEHGEPPKGKAWPFPVINSYDTVRRAVPELATGTASALSQKAGKRWTKDRYDTLIRNNQSPPHFKNTMPIPIRRQEVTFRQVDGKYSISFPLEAVSTVPEARRYIVPVRARDEFQKKTLECLSTGEWRIGEVVIKPDRRENGKWYVVIAYKRLIENVQSSERVAAINKGILCSIAMVTYGGTVMIDDGHDIEEYLRRCNAYRREFQRTKKFCARQGRGRKRLLRPTDRIRGKTERYRKTRIQTTARAYAAACAEEKVSVVFIEDFTGIRHGLPEKLHGGKMVWDRIQTWPYYELQTRFISCLEEYGIAAVVIPPGDISRACPQCGHLHEYKRILKGRTFECDECGYKRHFDVVQAQNLMRIGIERLRDAKNDVTKIRENVVSKRSGKSGARKEERKAAKVEKKKTKPPKGKRR